MIKLNSKQLEFIKKKESVIALRNNDIEKFLLSASEAERPVFCQFLMECGVDIFLYMKKIPENCFTNSEFLTGLTIPQTVEEIGSEAFSRCFKLKNVSIDDSVTMMGSGVFSGCIALESVKLPEKLGRIPRQCFQSCSSLKEIFIPDSVTVIGAKAFDGCDSIVIKCNRRDAGNQLRISKTDVDFFKKHLKYKKSQGGQN